MPNTYIKRNNTLTNSNPTAPPSLEYGELAMNYKSGYERLFAKNDAGTIFAFNDWTKIFNKPTTLTGYGITDAQPINTDLTAIGSLSGTSGFLTKTATNTWALDTSTYLKANQTITLSGAVTGSGSTAIVTSYAETVPTNKGGTGLTSIGTAGQVLQVNSGGTGLEWGTVSGSGESRDKGVNNVTTLASLPISKRLVYATVTAATSISLSAAMEIGDELHIIVYNSSYSTRTQALPNSGSFISLSGTSISLPSRGRVEINILCYATNSYIIRAL